MPDPNPRLTLPAALPAAKQTVLADILNRLMTIAGIRAIVLGGSYAQGSQRPDSDVDLGLYYDAESPFAIEAIRQTAAAVSQNGAPVVTDFYEWGAWVNGGAWIHTAAGKVDFLYRNLNQVRQTLADAHEGRLALDYQQQPPYGFPSVIYLAETHICQPLYDPAGIIATLKQQTSPYPPRMKSAIIQNNLWGIEFTLLHARDFARSGDVYNTVGCLTRSLSYLTQVIFALNETYFISDKRAVAAIEHFSIRPDAYAAQVNRILGHPGQTAAELTATVEALQNLFQHTVALAAGQYQPRYIL
jgi:hypothetical protein